MTQFRKSVPRPVAGAGSPKGKNGNVTVVYVDDLLAFPPVNADGVLLIGTIILKPSSKMEKIYMTDASQKVSHKYDGDPDAGGLTKMFEGTHPGDELEINEFIQNNLEVPVILIYDLDCNTGKRKVVGLPCNPMYLKPEFEDAEGGVKHTLVYEQRRRDRHVSKFYEGELILADNYTSPSLDLALETDNGFVYQLPVSNATASITIDTLDIVNRKVVSLVGSGGTTPATLTGGVSGPVTVILSDGTPWVALKDAVIHLEVFDAGSVIYLKELSRS